MIMIHASAWRIAVSLVLTFLGLAHESHASPEPLSSEIDRALDESLSRGGKITMEQKFEPLMKFGAAAIPGLIARYEQKQDRQRTDIVWILCHLGTPDARKFLKKIAGQREDKDAMDSAFIFYPEERIDEIMPAAVEAVARQFAGYRASERIQKSVKRDPKLARFIIEGLKNQPPAKYDNYQLGCVLASITGRSAWQFRAAEENESNRDLGGVIFWRKWWDRNKDKSQFDWLVEAYSESQKSTQQRADALQWLGSLYDRRSIPICLAALDDGNDGVRYYGVCALKKLEGDERGYLFETFKAEEQEIIARLKSKFADKAQ